MYLLDTHVVSELRKPRPHGAVLAWLQGVADADLHLSAVTLGEIQAGIGITRDQDAVKAAEIEAWMDAVAGSYNVITIDAATFRAHARLMHHRSGAVFEDALIAATALQHRLTVVTRNVADFRPFGVPMLNPFQAPR